MTDEYAKIFNSTDYGQILATRSSLNSSNPSDLFVTLHFQQRQSIHSIKIKPNKPTRKGLFDLYNSLNYDGAVTYIKAYCKKTVEESIATENLINFRTIQRGSLQ